MSYLELVCVPRSVQGGGAVAPCASVAGVDYEPAMIATNELVAVSQSVSVFAWAFGLTLGVWFTGLVVGAIVSIIRRV